MAVQPKSQNQDPSARQREVLAVVLNLMVEEGDGFSMAKVARRASCSKETLYNWFGDRDGLLTATVQWQASKVRMPTITSGDFDAGQLERGLLEFAKSWLEVLTGDISAALNRLAISHAGSAKSQLGRIVLENGPIAISGRLKNVFDNAQRLGLLKIDDMDGALRSFFGLVVADWQIRKLLGERTKPSAQGIEIAAKRAVAQFLSLYRAGETQNIKTQQTGE